MNNAGNISDYQKEALETHQIDDIRKKLIFGLVGIL